MACTVVLVDVYNRTVTNSKQNIERVVDGFHARVVQHEMDHIDGVLFPHRGEDMKML